MGIRIGLDHIVVMKGVVEGVVEGVMEGVVEGVVILDRTNRSWIEVLPDGAG